jgi:hypothetical protein
MQTILFLPLYLAGLVWLVVATRSKSGKARADAALPVPMLRKMR